MTVSDKMPQPNIEEDGLEPQIKVELQSFFGSDRDIAGAAWTSSFDLERKLSRTDADVERVINLLADEKHSVPFESVIFRFWIRLPVAIDRQHMTHRIASHSGMSGRYRTMPLEFYHIPDDVINICNKLPQVQYDATPEFSYESVCKLANQYYGELTKSFKSSKDKGVISNDEYKRLREFFRGMLPQHNMTERVTVINLRSWANYYKLRHKPNAQKEIQIIAELMKKEILSKNIAPIAIAALERNNWVI